ncbi:hypothetical protein ST201phi2-1p244 [Pseudomonas phage 201phi2-1]|uniref:Uncharacterized protein n=1 Tax=Pseudomonas phage 201phi2-1 TaxID=198110 RepID=B3FJA6_BP201|nr:hypothetical protein ST201phi2-1p244 [Pseudomonas phage 201phi2-1]ABY63072.1 hypothetical protein 201phi2-1p244 [Pseudomonas phage 201phi2-1]
MKIFELPLSVNTLGSDPTLHLFNALNEAYPEYELTRENSRILKIQPAVTSTYPNLTYLRIQKGDDPEDVFEFFYNRYNINDYITNPLFTASEAAQAAALPNSAKLVDVISAKVQLNMQPNDFWTSINSLDYSGGTDGPNWSMQSVYDSVYWCGSMYVWLHT